MQEFFTGFLGALFAVFLIQLIRVMFERDITDYKIDGSAIEEIDQLLHSGDTHSVNLVTKVITTTGKDGLNKLFTLNGVDEIIRVSFGESVTVDYKEDGDVKTLVFKR